MDKPTKSPPKAISIHALREEGDAVAPALLCALEISIHALREEGDLQPPAADPQQQISIHALREEGDRPGPRVAVTDFFRFLSTPSARRATDGLAMYYEQIKFLSTPSARRATQSEGGH